MSNLIRTGTLALLLLIPLACWSATLTGRVVAVADGDTLTVLDADHQQHKIRLSGIDAPEKKQAFGAKSKEFLSHAVFGKNVEVEWTKLDRYQRKLGKVFATGDVGLAQITQGLAWHYKKYEREQTAVDRATYAQAEIAARSSRVGLWADNNPVAPWDFRHNK